MKKIAKLMLVLVALFTLTLTANAAKDKETKTEDKKVTLYLFRQTGCPHCADELLYLNKNAKKYNGRLEIVVFNIFDGKNSDLAYMAAKAVGVEYEGAPFNVIGKQHFTGYADSIEADFEEFLENGIKAKEEDVVGKLISSGKYEDLKSTTVAEAIEEEKLNSSEAEEESNDKKASDTVIILIIAAVVALSIGSLVYYSKKEN
ncbi:MAG: thioredoxin family protein [Bacilli bacterium]|nr:thioredoxin family protein [Bacilli bacterium]